MNKLTSRQRKLLYAGCIVVLMIPIILLGAPGGPQESKPFEGKISKMRTEYELGETTLGQVDPSSATMNLMLLGLRGIATDLLWVQAQEMQRTKRWAELRTTVDSIILLQPHYMKVWNFQGWNLAYNVSVEWDGVGDRYYWVKEGAKFLRKGTVRNKHYPDLYWYFGNILSKKIGRSDEWRHFRIFFRDQDPDPNIEGPDVDLNPDGLDNYLVSRGVFEEANERELKYPQSIMARVLFRQYPARAQLDYSDAMQREGNFNEETQAGWSEGYRVWTGDYGQEVFMTPGGKIRLDAEEEDLPDLLALDDEGQEFTKEQKAHWLDRYQKMTNYLYWELRSRVERDPETVRMHRLIYDAEKMYRDGEVAATLFRATADGKKALEKEENDLSEEEKKVLTFLSTQKSPITRKTLREEGKITGKDGAEALTSLEEKLFIVRLSEAQNKLEEGMVLYAKLLEENPRLQNEDITLEEGLMAVLYYRNNFITNQQKVPTDYALHELYTTNNEKAAELRSQFNRELSGYLY